MLFNKILVAYDGSDLGDKALAKAIEMSRSNQDAILEVVHVVAFPTPSALHDTFSAYDFNKNLMDHGQEIADRIEERLASLPNKTQVFLKQGPPSYTILEHVKEHNNEVIIMGSRGLSGLKELFLGSVSYNVVQHSPVPVLIMK